MTSSAPHEGEWGMALTLFAVGSLFKLLALAPGIYHSTDFEVHRNWLAITHSTPLNEWYWEDTSEWTLDYPPMFGYFEWALSQAARLVEPDMLKITQQYDPSGAAVWFQRLSVMAADATLVLGVVAWCKGANKERRDSIHGSDGGGGGGGGALQEGTTLYVGSLVLLNSGLFLVDHVHFQYNGFMLGLLLLSMGLIRQGRVLSGGATFACLLMLKHLFLTLAPLYFVYLLRSYCYRSTVCTSSSGSSSAPHVATARLSLKRLASLGSAVLCVFGSALGPLCVSDGWTTEACLRQLGQLGVRLFPFGRQAGLVHAYWAPNVWAVYLFLDRVLLALLKVIGLATAADGKGSTTGGLVRTEVMAVLPPVPAGVCLLFSLLACVPALVVAWRNPSPQAFAWGTVHCSLSSFLLGFHVHEKALLVPAVVSAVLAVGSRAGATMHLRLSFLATFAAFPLLPGQELKVVKVMLLIAHLTLATSLLEHLHGQRKRSAARVGTSSRAASSNSPSSRPQPEKLGTVGEASGGGVDAEEREAERRRGGCDSPRGKGSGDTQSLCTFWDKLYLAGAAVVWAFAEVFHPWLLGEGTLPFLPLMGMSVFGAVGVVACWGLSVAGCLSLLPPAV
ncbi:unnamed protein product [Scytosiphon promiscuus]